MKTSEITRLSLRSAAQARWRRSLRTLLEISSALVLVGLLAYEIGLHAGAGSPMPDADTAAAGICLPEPPAAAPCAVADDLVRPASHGTSVATGGEVQSMRPQARRPVSGSVLHGAIVPLQ